MYKCLLRDTNVVLPILQAIHSTNVNVMFAAYSYSYGLGLGGG